MMPLHTLSSLLFSIFLSITIIFTLIFPSNSLSETIKKKVRGNITAFAEYRVPPRFPHGKRAALILHDFLQTHHTRAVRKISEAALKQGYAVLAPSLSYGRNLRRQPLRCTSVHTHTAGQDKQELKSWIQWLRNKGYRQITLIGHATNSALILDMPLNAIHRVILVGYAPFNRSSAVHAVDTRTPSLKKWHLLPCGTRYLATRTSFNSYHRLTNANLSKKFKQSASKIKIIAPKMVLRQRNNDYLALTGGQTRRIVTVSGNNTVLFSGQTPQLRKNIEHILVYNR